MCAGRWISVGPHRTLQRAAAERSLASIDFNDLVEHLEDAGTLEPHVTAGRLGYALCRRDNDVPLAPSACARSVGWHAGETHALQLRRARHVAVVLPDGDTCEEAVALGASAAHV